MLRAVLFAFTLAVAILGASGCSAGIQNDGVFRFGKNVPEEERAPIRAGVEAMENWIAANGNVHLKRFQVQVDDNINTLVSMYYDETQTEEPLVIAQWLVSGGAITAGDHVYIYAGPEWKEYSDADKSFIAAHETFHVAQYGFLYDDWFHGVGEASKAPPAWMREGGADYAAARALDAAGIRRFAEYDAQAAAQAESYRESLATISSTGGDRPSGDAAPYAVGFGAVAALAAAHGESAMFDFWDKLAEDGTWEWAFSDAYSENAREFVAAFDSKRESDTEIPSGGVAGVLKREAGEPVAGASIGACAETATANVDCRFTWSAEDGSFELALPPGEWRLFYRVATRNAIETGKFKRGGSDVESLEVELEVVRGLEASVRKPF